MSSGTAYERMFVGYVSLAVLYSVILSNYYHYVSNIDPFEGPQLLVTVLPWVPIVVVFFGVVAYIGVSELIGGLREVRQPDE